MSKFKGKFQAPCMVNRGGRPWLRMFEHYEANYEEYRHCHCDVCTLQREENGVTRCVDKSCEGCQNLASGKKVRDYIQDMLKGADKVEKR